MKNARRTAVSFILAFGMVLPGYTTVLVSNVWNTGVRTYPAHNGPNSPYSEMGVDYNASGDLESAWYNGSGGTTSSTNHLVTTVSSKSSSWTTDWVDSNTMGFPVRFYRVVPGPPFP